MTQRWWRAPILVLIAGGIVLGLGMGLRQTLGLFIESIHLSTGVSIASISLAIAVQNLLWGVATPFCGMLADRYGAGRFLALGGLLYGAGLMLLSQADSALMIHLSAGGLIGLGVSAAGFPLVLAAVARAAPPERRSTWLGIASAGGSVGQFLLLPGSQFLIAGVGWVPAMLALAALAFLVVPLAVSLSGKPAAEHGPASQSLLAALQEACRHRGYLLLTGGFFVCGFHVAFVATHLPGYIVSCNLSAFTGATALGLIGFFNILGSFTAGWLGERYRKKYLLSGIYLLRAIVIGLFLLGPKTDWAVWLFGGAFGFLWLSTVPLTSGLVGQIFGARYMATLFGIVMMGHQVGAFFGAWLGGLSLDLTGNYDSVWIMSILLGVLAAVLHWPIGDRPVLRPAVAAERA